MTPEQLAAIRARAEAATPGPWTVDEGLVWDDGTGECECQWYREIRGWTDHGVQCEAGYLILSREDAEFIAHAREDIPRLLDEVEALRAWSERVLADAQAAWRRYHAVRAAADGLREELERLVLSHHATLEEGLQCDRCEDAVNEIVDYDALEQQEPFASVGEGRGEITDITDSVQSLIKRLTEAEERWADACQERDALRARAERAEAMCVALRNALDAMGVTFSADETRLVALVIGGKPIAHYPDMEARIERIAAAHARRLQLIAADDPGAQIRQVVDAARRFVQALDATEASIRPDPEGVIDGPHGQALRAAVAALDAAREEPR